MNEWNRYPQSMLTSLIVSKQTPKENPMGSTLLRRNKFPSLRLSRTLQSVRGTYFVFPSGWFHPNVTRQLIASHFTTFWGVMNEWRWRQELIKKPTLNIRLAKKMCQMQKILKALLRLQTASIWQIFFSFKGSRWYNREIVNKRKLKMMVIDER